jgi:hypothetical protein
MSNLLFSPSTLLKNSSLHGHIHLILGMQYSRTGITIFLLLLPFTLLMAQQDSASKKIQLLKLNLPALLFKNLSVQYEQQTKPKQSFAINLRYRPLGSVPFINTIKEVIDDDAIKFEEFKMGIVGITPEYRWYVGKKDGLRGFYIGAFASYNYYTGRVPVNYLNDAKTALYKGGINTYTAGVQLGAQWKLGGRWYLDWWILGPNYGLSRGNFIFNGALNDVEQISMQFELERIKLATLFNLVESYSVGPDGVTLRIKGPWAGVRAFGLSVGLKL